MTTIANSAGAVSPHFNPFVLVDKRIHSFIPQIGLVGLGVYHALANYADNRTRLCWPRQSTIAEFLCISRQAVNEAISTLAELGLVEVVQRRPGYSHVYRLCDTAGIPAPGEASGGGVAVDDTPSGGDVNPGDTIELDPLLFNYTQKQQQPAPVLEPATPVEPVAVVVVSSNQESAQNEIEASQAVPSETATLAETLPLPKTTAEKILERAPAQERRAIVETFNAASAKRSILKPAAYLAALVQAVIAGTFTPESIQQSQQAQETRHRKAEALARSSAENERRAMERLGLAGPGRTATGPGGAQSRSGPDVSGKVSALRAALRRGAVLRV